MFGISSGLVVSTSGIGLGLSVCKQLVEKLGGHINLKTVIDEGTEVSFTIPIKCMQCE